MPKGGFELIGVYGKIRVEIFLIGVIGMIGFPEQKGILNKQLLLFFGDSRCPCDGNVGKVPLSDK